MHDRIKDPERHAKRMAAKQKIMQERIANANKEQGILLVLAKAKAVPALAWWRVLWGTV